MLQSAPIRQQLRHLPLFLSIVIAVSGCVVCRVSGAAAVNQPPSTLSVSLDIGFDDYFNMGAWAPVQVDLQNDGPPVAGELNIDVAAAAPIDNDNHTLLYRTPIELPSHSRKRVQLLVPVRQTFQPLKATITSDSGRVLFETSLSLHDHALHADTIVVLDTRAGGYNFLGRPGGAPLRVLYVTDPTALPDAWPAYSDVAGVIVGEFPLGRLSSAQAQALRTWVALGGRLLFTGGPQTESTQSPLFTELAPVRFANGVQGLRLTSLGPAYGPLPAPALLSAWETVAANAHVSAQLGSLPLSAYRWYGEGRVGFIAFDVTDPDLAGWSALASFTSDQIGLFDRTAPTLAQPAPLSDSAIWPLIRSQAVSTLGNWPILPLAAAYIVILGIGVFWARPAPKRWWVLLGAASSVSAGIAVILPRAEQADHAVVAVTVTQVARTVHLAHVTTFAGLTQRTSAPWSLTSDAIYVSRPAAPGGPAGSALLVDRSATGESVQSSDPINWMPVVLDRTTTYPLDAVIQSRADETSLVVQNDLPTALTDLVFVDATQVLPLGTVPAHSSKTFPISDQQRWWSGRPAPDLLAEQAVDTIAHRDDIPDKFELSALRELVREALGEHPGAQTTPWGLPILAGATDGSELPRAFAGAPAQRSAHVFVLPLADPVDHPLPTSISLDWLKQEVKS